MQGAAFFWNENGNKETKTGNFTEVAYEVGSEENKVHKKVYFKIIHVKKMMNEYTWKGKINLWSVIVLFCRVLT